VEVLILAAGKGTRMKSSKSKVLFEIAGKPMLAWVIDSVLPLNVQKINILIGFEGDIVKNQILNIYQHKKELFNFIVQKEQLGTGHAVKTFVDNTNFSSENLMVLCGDTPMLDNSELESFRKLHDNNNSVVSVISMVPEENYGYGRMVRDVEGNLEKIVEQKDCDEIKAEIREVNSGIYIFDKSFLIDNISNLSNKNSQNEFYLTDIVEFAYKSGKPASVLKGKFENLTGINDIQALSEARKVLHMRINNELMLNGVDIYSPETVFIDSSVKIENDVTIYPFSVIKGQSIIKKGSTVGPYACIKDSELEGAEIVFSHATGAKMKQQSSSGPFSRLREKTVLEEKVKTGNFVEIKNSVLKNNVKASHLTYIGDSEIDENSNIGAGTITCNYDGKNKHKTRIGKNCFIGSNSTLIAPLEVGDNSFIAGGSVINKNVPEKSLAFGRARQVIKTNYKK